MKLQQSSLKSFFSRSESANTNSTFSTAITTATVGTTSRSFSCITTTSSSGKTTVVSDYELLREENIRRNQELLKKLGLTSPANLLPTKSSISKSKQNPISLPSVPLRRSTRKRPAPQTQSDEETDFPGEPVQDLQFEQSSVYNYACKRVCVRESVGGASSSADFVGFEMVAQPLADPLLSRIYTMDVCSAGDGEPRVLVAAGGHGGFISIYGTSLDSCTEDEDEEDGGKDEVIGPLMSWKSSRTWVSGIRFAGSNAMLVVSTSNDGGIVIWDVSKQPISSSASWSPPIVGQVRDLHSGGIYSMDLLKDVVVTASKDSSVGFCRMDGCGGVLVDRSVSGHHSGVVRGVSFRDPDVLADCGADGRICILDARLPEPCTMTIDSDHSTGINTVEWSRADEFMLLSASKDPELLLYDVRSPTQPFHKLHGHVESNVRSCNKIYRPTFIENHGTYIATSGQGSKKISIYEVATGRIVSQGLIGYDANLVFCTSNVGVPPRLWAAGKQINQLSPIW